MTLVKSFDDCMEVLAGVFTPVGLRPQTGELADALRNQGGFVKASRFCWGDAEAEQYFDLSAMSVGKIFIISLLEADGTLRKATIHSGSTRDAVVEKLGQTLRLGDMLEVNRTGAKAALDKLPDPVLTLVLSFLRLPEVVRCFHVCRGFFAVSRSLELWKELYSRKNAQPLLRAGTREDVIKSYQHRQASLPRVPRFEPARSVVDPWQWTMLDYHYLDYL